MKKGLIIILCFLFSCSYLHRNENSKTLTSDSIAVGDISFVDFVDNFMLKKDFQMSRTLLKDWKYKNYYDVYECSLFFDNSFKIAGNELINEIGTKKYLSIIDSISFERKDLEFNKRDGKWFLKDQVISKFKPDQVDDFETFLYHFSTDSLFSNAHIKFPLKFSYSGDFDDSVIHTKYINIDSIPKYNFFEKGQLVFFHDNSFNSSKQVRIYERGNQCGILLYFYFRKMDGSWFLVEEKDFSD